MLYAWVYEKDILQSKKHKVCVFKVRQVGLKEVGDKKLKSITIGLPPSKYINSFSVLGEIYFSVECA